MPCSEIACADVTNLTALHEIVECVDGIFERCELVETVYLVKVNEISIQATKTVVDLLHDVLAGETISIWTGIHTPANFCGEYDVVTIRSDVADGLACKALRKSFGIYVGRVYKIDTCVECCFE